MRNCSKIIYLVKCDITWKMLFRLVCACGSVCTHHSSSVRSAKFTLVNTINNSIYLIFKYIYKRPTAFCSYTYEQKQNKPDDGVKARWAVNVNNKFAKALVTYFSDLTFSLKCMKNVSVQ